MWGTTANYPGSIPQGRGDEKQMRIYFSEIPILLIPSDTCPERETGRLTPEHLQGCLLLGTEKPELWLSLKDWELKELLENKYYNFICTLGISINTNLSKTWTECLPKSLTLPISLSESMRWSHAGQAFKIMSSQTLPFSTGRTVGLEMDSAHENVIASLGQHLQNVLVLKLSVKDRTLTFPKSTEFFP